ncbi:hypothetical protein [Dyadobacter sp. CY312]|uniref:hypothetical protein n=1 Tax=Dyadobacter sp. CY312 TaxID=2907303 RepID=UPI001F1C94D5|nr:hypothetical protein [Dyadobacter sp. CY312]MCE7039254.1 hypothetical protein [Dyadobacter sp. CY312]
MKALIAILLFLSFQAFAQETGEVTYHYRNEPFPYDSGVAISDRQYQFILFMQGINKAKMEAKVVPPKIVLHTITQRKKGDGNKLTWFGTGVGAAILIKVVHGLVTKK